MSLPGMHFDRKDRWKNVLYVNSLLINVSAVLNEGMSASWTRGSYTARYADPNP